MKIVETLREPGYRRNVMLRRIAALSLLCAAVINIVVSRGNDPVVVAFSTAVTAGEVVSADHVELRRMPAAMVPDTALRDATAATGQILAAPAAAGEVVTATRLVGPDLTKELAPSDASEPYSMVPVALAEPDIIPMLHHGATVSVVTIANGGTEPLSIATGARVVLTGAEDGTVMLLLPTSQATAVAAASLASPLTVVLERPHSAEV